MKLGVKQKYYWAGFILIVIIYSVYNLYLVDVGYYQSIPIRLRHAGKLAAVLSIYGVGTVALRKYTAAWMMYLWHSVHVIIIAFLLLVGIYNWFVGALSVPVHNITTTLFEFLISPVIYIGVGILNSKFGRQDKSPR